MPHKRRRRRRRRSPREGSSRRRRGEEGVSLYGSQVESDSSGTTSGAPLPESLDEPSDARPAREYESRYHEILASRLAELPLPAYADEEGPNLPSDETVEALVRPSFYDDQLRAALVEYQAQKFLSGPDDGDSGEFDSSSVMDDITEEDFQVDHARLRSRHIHEVDTDDELDEEELDRLSHKYARYRLKACLLLKGVPIDDAELECKYPPELDSNNFRLYLRDEAFGWWFDLGFSSPAALSDYQRLVPCNEGGDEYESWSEYREFYSTPETDRDYLLYWETIVKDLKWIEEHVLKAFSEWHELRGKAWRQAVRIATRFENIPLRLAYYGFEGGDEYESWSEYRELYSTRETDRDYLLYWETIVKDLKWVEEHVLKGYLEWHELRGKAWRQAVRIATRFENIPLRLAYYGFEEYITSNYLAFVKDLDSVFFEIWKLVNGPNQMSFRDAMEHVYEENPFPLRKRDFEHQLSRPGSLGLEEQFRRCTGGISKEVPQWIACELISQEVSFKCDLPKRYVQYARKKLKIAEVIVLIPKAEIPV